MHPVRLVTASALFDGADTSINIMRRIFRSQGAEVEYFEYLVESLHGRERSASAWWAVEAASSCPRR
ncbi:hypothetical protein [Streptomyces dysideae]|uniref:Uncharacterized protein n=1 Tax=Streptomyces dysideae TaxID=909626 RepID=A0A101UZ36_9ACTN|nr:hypothetical protein AQJ91_19100 [Streptomyces dysideae]